MSCPKMVKPSMIRPATSRITTTKSLVTATMLLYAPAPHIEDTVQSSLEHHYRQRLLCQHLEQCYTQSLEPLKTQGVSEAESQAPAADSQTAYGESAELASIATLSQRLAGILAVTGYAGSLWGVELADELAARNSLLAAFLRAREWDVERADTFLRETLIWRRENGLEGSSGSSGSSASDVAAARLDFPDDTIHHCHGTGPDGQPRTVVVLRLGQVMLEGTNPHPDL